MNRIVSDTSRPWRLLFVEVEGTVLHCLVGRPEKYSDREAASTQARRARAKRRLPTWSTAPVEARARDVELGDRHAVELDAALVDQPPRLRRRGDAERVDEERRQVHRIAVRQRAPRARPRAPRRWRTTRVEVRLRRLRPPPRRASARRSSARARASTPSARPRALGCSATSRHHCGSSSSGIRIVRPNISSGGAVSGMLLPTDELIFSPSHETRSGVVSTTCGSSP